MKPINKFLFALTPLLLVAACGGGDESLAVRASLAVFRFCRVAA